MRLVDESKERKSKGGGRSDRSKSKWGKYTHYSPDTDSRAAIRESAERALPALFLWLDARLQDGYTLSLRWVDEREAMRAELRAPGEDRLKAPAIAAYHAETLIALCALWYADTMGEPNWTDERMSAQEAYNW